MSKWMQAVGYSVIAAAVLWLMGVGDGDWDSFLRHVALMIGPFYASIQIERRFGGCGICRIWS